MKSMYEAMVNVIPEGAVSGARVTHFVVTPEDARWTEMRAAITGRRDVAVRPGRYARLDVGNVLMMSDTQAEQRSNLTAVIEARGDVLIAGLGLGLVILPIARKADVTSVTVIEQVPGVIALVEAPLRARLPARARKKLRVIEGDIHHWRPEAKGRQFDTIYFDIWPDSGDHEAEGRALRRRFAPFLRKGGWSGAWRGNVR